MGHKGDKMQNSSVESTESIIAKLKSIENISAKKMFGGHGIFYNDKMFGMVDSKGQAYLKVNENNQNFYEQRGAVKHSRMPYYSIPTEVLNDNSELNNWAQKSINILIK